MRSAVHGLLLNLNITNTTDDEFNQTLALSTPSLKAVVNKNEDPK